MANRRQRDDVPQLLSLDPAAFKALLQQHATTLGLQIGMDDDTLTRAQGSPLGQKITVFGQEIDGRIAVHPTEGWDANHDGSPSAWVINRWRNFGLSGSQLIWGGEAHALYPELRANPRQTCSTTRDESLRRMTTLREAALEGRRLVYNDDNIVLGLQLTHSGIFSMPYRGGGRNSVPAQFNPHPKFINVFQATEDKVISDDGLQLLRDRYIEVALWAYEAGFNFIDLKACHGYFMHHLLGAKRRTGRYGGSLENRMRLFTEIVEGIRAKKSDAQIGSRISIWDVIPTVDAEGKQIAGLPTGYNSSDYCFAVKPDGTWDEEEAVAFLQHCMSLGIETVSITFASPYYSSPWQRPAFFFPSDTEIDPVDPLYRCLEQVKITQRVKQRLPNLTVMGTSYSYLQHYMPQVLQWLVRNDYVDIPGVCRAFIANPRIVANILEEGKVERAKVCRTYSDCTSGARLGYVSGCLPLDPLFRKLGILPSIMAGKKAECDELPSFDDALSVFNGLQQL